MKIYDAELVRDTVDPRFNEICYNEIPAYNKGFSWSAIVFFIWKGSVITKFRNNEVIFWKPIDSLKRESTVSSWMPLRQIGLRLANGVLNSWGNRVTWAGGIF